MQQFSVWFAIYIQGDVHLCLNESPYKDFCLPFGHYSVVGSVESEKWTQQKWPEEGGLYFTIWLICKNGKKSLKNCSENYPILGKRKNKARLNNKNTFFFQVPNSQCERLTIFLLLRFCVKSKCTILENQKRPIW